jgi:hypothetical protein
MGVGVCCQNVSLSMAETRKLRIHYLWAMLTKMHCTMRVHWKEY